MVFNESIINSTTKGDQKLFADTMYICVTAGKYMNTLPFCNHLTYECHTICRAIAMTIPELSVVDGKYVGFIRKKTETGHDLELCTASHSWLVTPDGAIIDPYPVGYLAVNPVLVVTKGQYAPFGGELYIPDGAIKAQISTRELWKRSQALYKFIQSAPKV